MKILIIDIETTGFLPSGEIVEVGAVELCLNSGEKKIVFDKVIKPTCSNERLNNSWIVRNGYMTINDILRGVSFDSIKDELQELIYSYTDGATAYNNKFDFGFLETYGIRFSKKLKCPMILATNICRIKKTGRAAYCKGYKYPNVEEAYKFFYPDSDYVELHRGADDAFHEADIVHAIHKLGKFLQP